MDADLSYSGLSHIKSEKRGMTAFYYFLPLARLATCLEHGPVRWIQSHFFLDLFV